MHHYKMNQQQNGFEYDLEGYSFEIEDNDKFIYKLATKEGDYYLKTFPMAKGSSYMLVRVKADIIDNELFKIKRFTLLLQFILLLLFAVLSFFLAKISLKPTNRMISHLDRFIKDLVHDLNTPATAILLNTKMLIKNSKDKQGIKQLKRIQNSADRIASLYENLEIVLDHKLTKQKVDIVKLLHDEIEDFKLRYPDVDFILPKKARQLYTNEKALRRILENILSNSCKYVSNDPKVEIMLNEDTLIIRDNGIGIKYPQKVFERNYKESGEGHGIGMHIVQRLCNELNIKISIESNDDGTTIILRF